MRVVRMESPVTPAGLLAGFERATSLEFEKPLQEWLFEAVGATGFEPATARPPAECATRLRHAPKRATGLEPALRAWKALVQPLHHTRVRPESKASRAPPRGPAPAPRQGSVQRPRLRSPAMNAQSQKTVRRLRRAPALAALVVAAVCWVAPQADAHVYFASYNGNSISRADLDGGNLFPQIAAASSPTAVAIDGQHMYWTSGSTYDIGRANLDGTGAVGNFITGASNPSAIAVDAHHIYWTNTGTSSIGRADLDGPHADPTFIKNAGAPS